MCAHYRADRQTARAVQWACTPTILRQPLGLPRHLRESLNDVAAKHHHGHTTPVRQQSISLARDAAMSPQDDAFRRPHAFARHQPPAPQPVSALLACPHACRPVCRHSVQAWPGSRSRLEEAATKALPAPDPGLTPTHDTTQFLLTNHPPAAPS